MKYQSLFSGENMKNIIKVSSAGFDQSKASVLHLKKENIFNPTK